MMAAGVALGRVMALLTATLLLAGCAPERLQGVNLLQSRSVSYEQAPTAVSLDRLRSLGANTVAVVVFLSQDAPDATEIGRSAAVSDAQLLAAIRAARGQGLRVLLKPQLLVPGAWAGRIEPPDEAGWAKWFDAYTQHLLAYARVAQDEGVEGLVIGTELRRADTRPEWPRVIAAVREVFRGELSYAAHDIDGFANFAHWPLLDSAALTLYPSLGSDADPAAMRVHVEAAVRRLRVLAESLDKPVWIAELGIQSRQGAQLKPWEWQFPDEHAAADAALQADVIALWLEALRGDWNRGVLLWAWSNDPAAGGPSDRDYLLQNKVVEEVLKCHWLRRC